jgi:hypothetical protein
VIGIHYEQDPARAVIIADRLHSNRLLLRATNKVFRSQSAEYVASGAEHADRNFDCFARGLLRYASGCHTDN